MLISTEKNNTCLPRLAVLLLALCLCFSPAVPAFAFTIPEPNDSFYVNDTAGLLSKDKKDYIIASNEDLYQKTGAQVVVVTVPTLEGASIEEYATALFRNYGIGSAEKNNGVLILLSSGDRECRIEVGYGLEGAINDGKAGRIMDTYMIPFYKDNKWDEGTLNGFDAILDEIAAEYGIEVKHEKARIPSGSGEKADGYSDTWPMVLGGGVGLIVGLLFGALFPHKAAIPGILFLIVDLICLLNIFSTGTAILTFLLTIVAYLIGWAITSPDPGGSSGGYSGSRSSYSSRSSSGSRSYHSGGGGRSGGGGASRKF